MAVQTKAFKPRRPARNLRATRARAGAGDVFRRLGLLKDRAKLVQLIQRGFSVTVIEKLADELQVQQQTLLNITRIAPATLSRRRKSTSGLLSSDESDRVYRIAAAYRSALQLFEGDAESARRWIKEPAKALGGDTPLEHLNTEAGAAEVRDLIGRIEHGVYS